MVHIYRYYNSGILSHGYYTILAGIFVSVSILAKRQFKIEQRVGCTHDFNTKIDRDADIELKIPKV